MGLNQIFAAKPLVNFAEPWAPCVLLHLRSCAVSVEGQIQFWSYSSGLTQFYSEYNRSYYCIRISQTNIFFSVHTNVNP
jgi:hypothetical protein